MHLDRGKKVANGRSHDQSEVRTVPTRSQSIPGAINNKTTLTVGGSVAALVLANAQDNESQLTYCPILRTVSTLNNSTYVPESPSEFGLDATAGCLAWLSDSRAVGLRRYGRRLRYKVRRW
jgi:hypothetical protein